MEKVLKAGELTAFLAENFGYKISTVRLAYWRKLEPLPMPAKASEVAAWFWRRIEAKAKKTNPKASATVTELTPKVTA